MPSFEIEVTGEPRVADELASDTSRTSASVYAALGAQLGLRGARIRSDRDLLELIEAGLPTRSVKALARVGFLKEELHRLVIPRRTLSHRDARREPLTAEESDRAIAIARAGALAETVFGDRDRALAWLRAGKRRLGGRAPLDVVTTDVGARLVEEMLHQIDHGFSA